MWTYECQVKEDYHSIINAINAAQDAVHCVGARVQDWHVFMLLPTRTHRSSSAELLPSLSGPTLQICQHSSFPGQELIFILAGFHNVPVWAPQKGSPAFKHVTCSPSLMSSANLMRSTLSRYQIQVMALDELFPLQKPLPLLLSFTSLTFTALFYIPVQDQLPPPHSTVPYTGNTVDLI